jgi:hypothetical protein
MSGNYRVRNNSMLYVIPLVVSICSLHYESQHLLLIDTKKFYLKVQHPMCLMKSILYEIYRPYSRMFYVSQYFILVFKTPFSFHV